jgi:hypothetical protein
VLIISLERKFNKKRCLLLISKEHTPSPLLIEGNFPSLCKREGRRDFSRKLISVPLKCHLPSLTFRSKNNDMRIALLLFLFLFLVNPANAALHSVQSKDMTVFYEGALTSAVREVARVYPSVKSQLADTVGWGIDFSPDIVLVKDRETFRKMTGSDLVVAFAVPSKNLIVLDMSRVYAKPFTLETTLKHELCHLLLHCNIQGKNLPRWFDEGFCQWASGGVAELAAYGNDDLSNAVVSGRLMSMSELESFPSDGTSLKLAYEESKSFIEYIVGEYGRPGILHMLGYLKEGDSVNVSVRKSFLISMSGLEGNWHAYLKRRHTWFYYLSSNIYTIIFSIAAIVTIYGFFRLLKRKRAYVDENEEDEHSKE